MNAGIRALTHEGSRYIVNVTAARVAVHHAAHRQGVRDQRQIDHGLHIGTRVPMAGVFIRGADVALGYVELGFVGDIAQHAGFRAGSEQRALRPLEHLNTLEIRRVHVQISSGQCAGLIVEIHRDIRKTADAAGPLSTGQGRRQTAHVNRTLAGAAAGRGHVRQVAHEIIEGLHV